MTQALTKPRQDGLFPMEPTETEAATRLTKDTHMSDGEQGCVVEAARPWPRPRQRCHRLDQLSVNWESSFAFSTCSLTNGFENWQWLKLKAKGHIEKSKKWKRPSKAVGLTDFEAGIKYPNSGLPCCGCWKKRQKRIAKSVPKFSHLPPLLFAWILCDDHSHPKMTHKNQENLKENVVKHIFANPGREQYRLGCRATHLCPTICSHKVMVMPKVGGFSLALPGIQIFDHLSSLTTFTSLETASLSWFVTTIFISFQLWSLEEWRDVRTQLSSWS